MSTKRTNRSRKKTPRYRKVLHSFNTWYYQLTFRVRKVVGVFILLCGLSLIGGGFFLVREGIVWAYQVYQGTWHFSAHDDDYSDNSHEHFDFPLKESERHPKRRPNYKRDFDILNDTQLAAASRLGIKPQPTRAALEQQKSRLVLLHDTRYYQILPLKNSSPYLVPRAADFLTALGRLMQEYNGSTSRFYISSVLRTDEDVKRLSRVNRNASQNSTHCFGTTFDITYARFDVQGHTTEAHLKEDLARALYDLQAKGYCYVKYEIKQPCFHVTVR